MTEYRCPKCNHLFFKAKLMGRIETICPKCGYHYKLDKLGNFVMTVNNDLPKDAFVFTEVH